MEVEMIQILRDRFFEKLVCKIKKIQCSSTESGYWNARSEDGLRNPELRKSCFNNQKSTLFLVLFSTVGLSKLAMLTGNHS